PLAHPRTGPLHPAREPPHGGGRRQPLRNRRVDRRRPLLVEAGQAEGRRVRARAAAARLRQAGPLHADPDRARPLGARRRDRAVIDLARIGGPVACLGLALLLVATTRRDRIAGLGFGAFGSCLPAAAIVPHRPLEIVGSSVALLVVSAGVAALFVRIPWLFPVLALACVPARVGVHVGGASS